MVCSHTKNKTPKMKLFHIYPNANVAISKQNWLVNCKICITKCRAIFTYFMFCVLVGKWNILTIVMNQEQLLKGDCIHTEYCLLNIHYISQIK